MELTTEKTSQITLSKATSGYSNHVYLPHRGRLIGAQAFNSNLTPMPRCPYHEARGLELCGVSSAFAKSIPEHMKALITQRFYPCVAALQAYHREEYRVGLYKGFGHGAACAELRQDLLHFMREQRDSHSQYLTFLAFFEDVYDAEESQFERDLWTELSSLTSVELRTVDWPRGATTDPKADDFCFHLGGEAFFVVGLHGKSSRLSRRFPYPALVFNVFQQFEQLEASGQYLPMVKANRDRDRAFQGSVNPMVELHGDVYESIQFSGRANPADWQCPFKFNESKDS